MNKIQRERRAARRWRLIKNLAFLFVAGAAIIAGARTTQAIWPAPPLIVLVCVEDKDGPRNCKKYETLKELSSD